MLITMESVKRILMVLSGFLSSKWVHSLRGVPTGLLAPGAALPSVVWYTVGLRDFLLGVCVAIDTLLHRPLLVFCLFQGNVVESRCSTRIGHPDSSGVWLGGVMLRVWVHFWAPVAEGSSVSSGMLSLMSPVVFPLSAICLWIKTISSKVHIYLA